MSAYGSVYGSAYGEVYFGDVAEPVTTGYLPIGNADGTLLLQVT